jgi:hypothetical protein
MHRDVRKSDANMQGSKKKSISKHRLNIIHMPISYLVKGAHLIFLIAFLSIFMEASTWRVCRIKLILIKCMNGQKAIEYSSIYGVVLKLK